MQQQQKLNSNPYLLALVLLVSRLQRTSYTRSKEVYDVSYINGFLCQIREIWLHRYLYCPELQPGGAVPVGGIGEMVAVVSGRQFGVNEMSSKAMSP